MNQRIAVGLGEGIERLSGFWRGRVILSSFTAVELGYSEFMVGTGGPVLGSDLLSVLISDNDCE